MRVHGLGWLGIRTDRFDEMSHLFERVFALPVEEREQDYAVFRLPSAAKVEVYGSASPYNVHFTTGPVVGFLVEDIEGVSRALQAAGIELIGPIREWEEGYASQHFRARDGTVYELTKDPALLVQ